jgi:Ca-activated chloride channel family protein
MEWVSLENPLALILMLPVLLYVFVVARKNYANLTPGKRRLSLLLRCLALLSLFLAVSAPVMNLPRKKRALVYLLDVSASMSSEAKEAALAKIGEFEKDKGSSTRSALVLFAGRCRIAIAPTDKTVEVEEELSGRIMYGRTRERLKKEMLEDAGDQAKVAAAETKMSELERWTKEMETDETDLAGALVMARGLFEEDEEKIAVLFSDCAPTKGEVSREIAQLESSDIRLAVYPAKRPDRPEVMASRLVLPAQAKKMQPFDVEVHLTSNLETEGKVALYRNKYLVDEKTVKMKSGKSVMVFPNVAIREGFHEFEATVTSDKDTVFENNTARGAILVRGKPRVLYIEADEANAHYLEDALELEEIEVETRPGSGVPVSLNELLNYDTVIVSNIPAPQLTDDTMRLIEKYVDEMGGGFIMLGGDESFGLGGYYNTPIEKILPVKMPVKKTIEKPNIAICLVIDRSGSMTGAKVELAKEAAIASAEVLKGRDRIGVVAFDSQPYWVVQFTDADERAKIVNQISRLQAGGGTNIYPALEEAKRALDKENARVKHIILLSDGQTEGSGYQALVAKLAAAGMTLSTVAIGEDADRVLLQRMSIWGSGMFYYTTNFASIPQIFTKETMRASRSMLVEEPVQVNLRSSDDVLQGIDIENAPLLLGYVATTLKERAKLVLASDYGDPILASWRYGLGRTVAFTSNTKNWAMDWWDWDYFSKFWAQLVRSTISEGARELIDSRASVFTRGKKVTLSFDSRTKDGLFIDGLNQGLSLVTEEGPSVDIPVEQVAPGLYRAEFDMEDYGRFYRLLLIQKMGEETLDTGVIAVTESYSPEYRDTVSEEEVTAWMKSAGGVVDAGPADVLALRKAPPVSSTRLWPLFVILFIILLPLDIATRRL